MSKAKTTFPNTDNVMERSGMVDNPVTQTAEVDKKMESTQDKESIVCVEIGNFSKNTPIKMIPKKLKTMIAKGVILSFFIKNLPFENKQKFFRYYTTFK